MINDNGVFEKPCKVWNIENSWPHLPNLSAVSNSSQTMWWVLNFSRLPWQICNFYLFSRKNLPLDSHPSPAWSWFPRSRKVPSPQVASRWSLGQQWTPWVLRRSEEIGGWRMILGAPKRKRRNARSGSHDTIAGPERNWKGWCFGVMINTNAFTGPRKTHPQVGQYVLPIFHCKGVGCVYISSENAFDKSALLVDRNKLKQYQNWMKTSLGWSSYWAPG